jgi:hypothetical protein
VSAQLLSVSIGTTTSLHTFEACMVLDVRNLKTYFYTAAGVVQAVDGTTYTSPLMRSRCATFGDARSR